MKERTMTDEENRAALKEQADRAANGTYTDQQLADWVPKNFVPADPADQASRAAGISARVMAVIRAVRAQQATPEPPPAWRTDLTNDELIRKCREIAELAEAMETTEEIRSGDLAGDDYGRLEAFATFAIHHIKTLCDRLRADIKASAHDPAMQRRVK